MVKTAVWIALVLPADVVGKDKEAGENCAGALTAVPLNVTRCGLPGSLSFTVRLSEISPAARGRKATEIVQESPAARVEGDNGQVVAVTV